MMSHAKEGDLILIDSDNFMSRLFKAIDGCHYSSFKIVIRVGNDLKLRMLVSDIEDLSDDEGFYISSIKEFFESYDQLNIALYRYKNRNTQFYKRLEKLKVLANKEMPYDFDFDFRDSKTMSCLKLAQIGYGLNSFKNQNRNSFPFYSNLMCDLKLVEDFRPIINWYSFWK